ncbi:MAG: hypothetical protein SOV49_06540 [Erysipelotrichaceae bacterium]|nr:hypothetical protein [Erysipelotrichaceae bacterium]
MKKTGFYITKDFFEKMEDPYLKSNKEGNRPHCYCFKEDATGVYWMILLLSCVEKYRKIIEKKRKLGNPAIYFIAYFLQRICSPLLMHILKENI